MKQALRVAFGFLILWASVLHAEVRIVIDSGVDSGRPIGVVPFQWAGPGAAPEDIGGIVAADLRNSGKFNPLDRARLPQQPGSAQEVQPAAWSALGIDAVVVGQVTPNPDGSYNVAYQLVDTGGAPGTVLAQNSYKVNKQWLRYAGHTASDEVFEKLTGIKVRSVPVLPTLFRLTAVSSRMNCAYLTMTVTTSLSFTVHRNR